MVVPFGFVCCEISYRNSCSSRGVTVTTGVIQWGCSAWVRATRFNHERKNPSCEPDPGPEGSVGEAKCRSNALSAGLGSAVASLEFGESGAVAFGASAG